jgi:hypothetical protein
MDDPMIRSRLGRITGTRPLGPRIPSWGPSFFSRLFLGNRSVSDNRALTLTLRIPIGVK